MSTPDKVLRPSAEALKLHSSSVVVDLHHDIAMDVLARREAGEHGVLRKIWVPRLREAGIKVQVFPIFIDSAFLPEMALRREIALVNHLLEEIDDNPDEITLVRDYQDIQHALAAGRIAAVLALEGAEAIDPEFNVLGLLFRCGLRMLSLTWNRRTLFADGASSGSGSGGLTPLGAELVRKLESLKIVVDVSHLSEGSFWKLLEIAEKPLIASHSSARAICNHVRNLTDDQVKAIAERRGVVGIFIHPAVIDPSHPTISRVVDHIDQLVAVAGIDHVAVGTDFIADLTGIEHTPTKEWNMTKEVAFSRIDGLSEITQLPNLTHELLIRGYEPEGIRKILGENTIRVFREIWGP